MKYYHGSKDPNLKELVTDHYEGKLYVTDSYPLAVMYGGCSLRNWNYDKGNDVLILFESTHEAFDKMYKGSSFYIYTCEVEDAIKDEENISNHTFKVNHNVKLNEDKEYIEDAYQKILELEKEGKIKLVYFKDLSKEEQKRRREKNINAWKPFMQKELEDFPQEYELLVSLFPELEIRKRR